MDHDEYIKIIADECRIPSKREFFGILNLSRAEHMNIIATLSGIAIGICSVEKLLKEMARK